MARTQPTMSLTEAAERLGVHYMTAYRYVRTGRLTGQKVGQEWQVATAEVEALAAAQAGPQKPTRTRGSRRDYPDRLVERLIRGDEAGAWTLVESALTGGMEPEEIYLDLLVPALVSIGDGWAAGELSVADEHQASAIVLRLVGRLGPRFARRGRPRGTVILGAPPGDVHSIPTALLRDLLRGRGFAVLDLGADVPAESWGATAASTDNLVAVGICATTPDNTRNIRAAIRAIRGAATAPIVLGGGAVGAGTDAQATGATARSGSFAEALELIDDLAAGHAA